MISTPQLSAEQLQKLRLRLSPALADFRLWREDIREGEEWKPPHPVITHVLKRWLIPRGASLGERRLDQVLEHGGRWHAQIWLEPEPETSSPCCYYARVRLHEDEWEVESFGYCWHEEIAKGIEWLNEHDAELDGEARLVSSSLYKFSSFWLSPSHEHLVVSTTVAGLATGVLLPQEELRKRLLAQFGPRYGGAGIHRDRDRGG